MISEVVSVFGMGFLRVEKRMWLESESHGEGFGLHLLLFIYFLVRRKGCFSFLGWLDGDFNDQSQHN